MAQTQVTKEKRYCLSVHKLREIHTSRNPEEVGVPVLRVSQKMKDSDADMIGAG